jgi:hypothetical protein
MSGPTCKRVVDKEGSTCIALGCLGGVSMFDMASEHIHRKMNKSFIISICMVAYLSVLLLGGVTSLTIATSQILNHLDPILRISGLSGSM